jgi:hypothetical protein
VNPRKSARGKRKPSTAKAAAWKWFSAWVRLRYADASGYVKCWTCDAVKHWKEMHAGHWIPKKRGNSVYFEERNVRPQCPSCNMFYEGMGHIFTQRMIDEFGPGIVDEMESLARTTVQYRLCDYEAIEAEYRGRVRALSEEG